MNSVGGVFLEKEINGKPFHVLRLLPQTDSSSSSSSTSSSDSGGGDNDHSLQTRFFCPDFRSKADECFNVDEYRTLFKGVEIVKFSTSPRFNKGTVDKLVLDHGGDDQYICKHPVLPLFWFNNEKPNQYCSACEKPDQVSSGYYLCERCKYVFHKECVEAPLFIKHHPSYPSLSLQLCTRSRTRSWNCVFCETKISAFVIYYCPTYKVSMHLICALQAIPIIIDHFKRHPHPLTFFPKHASLACDICGMIKELIPTYICARCVFVVHRDCIYFPYVIRICRHHHRISFTYSLPSGNLLCGVCRRKVDNSYGAYSCNKCDEGYFVHSRCALRRDLWDGEELEGTPEEIEIVEDPFKTIADGIILHFSHGHHLKLEICRDYDEDKYCQACLLPIYEGNYYSCVDDHCDFILHETCANAPRKIRHPLHAHPLTLKVVPGEYVYEDGLFCCSACQRKSNGFVYEGEHDSFVLDLRCASISEPFNYGGHDHPLFLALTPDEEKEAKCQICHLNGNYHHYDLTLGMLNCIECDFIICFRCATLPYKAKYKHDKHFLTFRKELVATTDQSDWSDDQSDWCDDQSDWCEACERKIVYSGDGGYYACDKYCCTTLHVHCLLGKDPYMKHGQTISQNGKDLHILRNNTMSRPLCHGFHCEERCPHRVIFQLYDRTYCSYYCAEEYLC